MSKVKEFELYWGDIRLGNLISDKSVTINEKEEPGIGDFVTIENTLVSPTINDLHYVKSFVIYTHKDSLSGVSTDIVHVSLISMDGEVKERPLSSVLKLDMEEELYNYTLSKFQNN